MVPALDGGEDLVWICGPDERLRVVVCLGEEAIDGGLEIDDQVEHVALKPTFAELGEEALDGIEPTGGGRGEVEDETGMAAEPGAHLGVLVGGIVAEPAFLEWQAGLGAVEGLDLALLSTMAWAGGST